MALRFGDQLDEETSAAEVDEIVAALRAQPDIPAPAPSSGRPAPRRATRRKSPPPAPAVDVSRETSNEDGGFEFAADPEPDYGRNDHLADRLFPDEPKSPKAITKAVQKDIKAKVAMLLTVAGAGWASRDPHCGGALLDAVPDRVVASEDPTADLETAPGLASALTDIFIDSPDIVSWFTSSGKYMKYLTLATVLQPLLSTLWAHHISHKLQDVEQGEPDWSAYATH